MSLLANLILAIAQVIKMVLDLYTFVILISSVLSWVNPDPYNPIISMIRQITEPVYQKVRRFLPASFFRSGIDFTPMIVLLLIVVINTVLVGTLQDVAVQMRASSLR